MRFWIAGVLSAALLLVPALPAGAVVHEVQVQDGAFSPTELTIVKGDTVRWVWEAGAATITDGEPDDLEHAGTRFDAPLDAVHEIFEQVFPEPETVHYFSRSNPDMQGTITVLDGTPVNRRTWGWLKRVFENPASGGVRR